MSAPSADPAATRQSRSAGRARRTLGMLALPLVLALLVLLPLMTGRGYTLRGDMVFVPDQPWKPAWLGLDGGVPRSVPADALTWLLGTVVPGDLVQKACLLLILVLAGVGTARLVRSAVGADGARSRFASWLVTAAPVVLVVWNPYVYERLSIGHWSLLCGYAALPWVVVAAAGPVPFRSAVPVAVAAWTSPSGGVLAAMTAVVVAASGEGRRGRRVLWTALGAAAVNLPWIVPGVLGPGPAAGEGRAGVEAFAARADTPWGDLGSLLSFGGLWKLSVAAPGRDDLVLSGVSLALTGLGALGLVGLARRRGRRLPLALGALAVAGLLLAWAPTTPPGQSAAAWAATSLPGGGLLRDSQKWIAPLVLATAVGVAEVVRGWVARGFNGEFWSVALTVTPLAVLPGLAWGLSGDLSTAEYPAEWVQVRSLLERAGGADARTAVLPLSVYRRFPWNHETAVLDPAPRFFPGDVVVDDSLPVQGGVVPGEDTTARRLRAADGSSAALTRALAREGIRFALVERTTPGAQGVPEPQGTLLHEGTELSLIDLHVSGRPPSLDRAGRAAVLAGDALALGVALGAGYAGVRGGGYTGRARR